MGESLPVSQADLLNRQGADLFVQGDVAGAKAKYLAALKADQQWLPALANLIHILSTENDLVPALAFANKILAFDPYNGQQWSNVGNFLTRLYRYDEAVAALERAADLIPDDRSVWHNLALLYHRMDDNEAALGHIQHVKDMGGAENYHVLNDESHMRLAMGDLKRGLEVYECRWQHLTHLQAWDFHIPEWTGQDLEGKTLLLHAEQGYGDTIMTSRFAPILTDYGAKVILGLPRSMCDLFECQSWCEGVLAIEDMNDQNMSQFDYQSPMYSAMRHLEIDKDSISGAPYLTAPEIVVPTVYKNSFNVGICWASGKRNNELDWRRRITPLNLWFVLSEIPNVQLWSLYKDEENDPHKEISQAVVQDVMPRIKTWAETAAFVSQLDAVVTIDTAIGHLAGAMGKTTIMLSQYQHCWRWWNLSGGSGQPWYNSMDIIPQTRPNDWEYQLTQARSELEFVFRGRALQMLQMVAA